MNKETVIKYNLGETTSSSNDILVLILSIIFILLILIQVISFALLYLYYRKSTNFTAQGKVTFVYYIPEKRLKRVGWKNFSKHIPESGFLTEICDYNWHDISFLSESFELHNSVKIFNKFNRAIEKNKYYKSFMKSNDGKFYKIEIYEYNSATKEVFFSIAWDDTQNVSSRVTEFIKGNLKKKDKYFTALACNLKSRYLENYILFKEDFLDNMIYSERIYFRKDEDLFYLIIGARTLPNLVKKTNKFVANNKEIFEYVIEQNTYEKIKDIKFTNENILYCKTSDDFEEYFKNYKNKLMAYIYNNLYDMDTIDKYLIKKSLLLSEIYDIKMKRVADINTNKKLGSLMRINVKPQAKIIEDWTYIESNYRNKVFSSINVDKIKQNTFVLINENLLTINFEPAIDSKIIPVIVFENFNKNSMKIVEKINLSKIKYGIYIKEINNKYIELLKKITPSYLFFGRKFSLPNNARELTFMLSVAALSEKDKTKIVFNKIDKKINHKLIEDMNINYIITE